MATNKNLDFTADVIEYLTSIGMTYYQSSWARNAGGNEYIQLFDRKGEYLFAAHHTTTKLTLQYMFSYGNRQFETGKRTTQRAIIEALGLGMNKND